jgi:hypothetical protein
MFLDDFAGTGKKQGIFVAKRQNSQISRQFRKIPENNSGLKLLIRELTANLRRPRKHCCYSPAEDYPPEDDLSIRSKSVSV